MLNGTAIPMRATSERRRRTSNHTHEDIVTTRIYAHDPNTATLKRGKSVTWDAHETTTLSSIDNVMPPVIRYLDRSSKQAVLERPPQRLTIQYYPGNKMQAARATPETGVKTFSIALPWQIYHARFKPHGGKLWAAMLQPFTRPRPLTPDDQQLYRMPLPNVINDYHLHYVCDSTQKPDVGGMDLVQATMAYVTNFFVSGFNDNAGHRPKYKDTFTGRQNWTAVLQKLEECDPQEVCDAIDRGEFEAVGTLAEMVETRQRVPIQPNGKLQP